MKRILSLALSLVLTFSLAVPALAAEDTDPPLWQEYGYGSREECIEWMYGGDEAAYQAEVDALLERQAWEDSMADEIAAFDPEAYWNSDECWYSSWYGSKEAFMEDWLLDTQEQFEDVMLEDWLDGRWQAYQAATLISRTLTELGGTPGRVGVMLDGKYIDFDEGAPEVVSGVTMVPCRPVMEALGGIVSRQGDDVVCTMSGTIFRLSCGSGTISVTTADGAASSEISLGAACYEKNGVTYMPLRPFAEAMGCDVEWDASFDTAVLLRRDSLVAQLDENFTVLNRMISALAADPEKNYRTAAEFDARIKVLDSINGDKNYSLDAQMEALQSGSVLNFSAAMDLSALMELENFTGLSLVEQSALRTALRKMQADFIYDGEEGKMYFKCSLMSLLTDGVIPADSWVSMVVPTLESVALRGSVTVGALLYESLLSQAQYGSSYYYEGMLTPATVCRNLQESSEALAAYLGDDCFQESGGFDVLHYGEDEYNAALEAQYGPGSAEYMSDFDQLEAELKIARSGSATFRVLTQTKDQPYFSYASPVILVDASGHLTPTKVDMKLLVKVKNAMELNLTYTAAVAVTTDVPAAQPPAGATVVDPYELEPLPENAA